MGKHGELLWLTNQKPQLQLGGETSAQGSIQLRLSDRKAFCAAAGTDMVYISAHSRAYTEHYIPYHIYAKHTHAKKTYDYQLPLLCVIQ